MTIPRHVLPVCVLLALVLGAPRAGADDGSWATGRGYTPAEGALYSETGNPDVVMEKEYLELRDVGLGATRAVFQFRNARDEPLTVECAFPIRFDFTARQSVPETWDLGDDNGFVSDVLAALGVPTAGTSFRDDQYPRGRKELDPAKLLRLFEFRILQDGRELTVESCIADFGEGPGHLVLHFRHQLPFSPGGTSVVRFLADAGSGRSMVPTNTTTAAPRCLMAATIPAKVACGQGQAPKRAMAEGSAANTRTGWPVVRVAW